MKIFLIVHIEQHCSFSGESATILAVCQIIKNQISNASQLLYPSDSGYNETIAHYSLSSIMPSVCSVEPGTAGDVSTIVSIVKYLFT